MSENEEQDRIIIPDDNGEEHLFDVLFTFDVDEWDKSYMIVSPVDSEDEEETEDGTQEVFAFRYEDEDGEFALFPIESDEEWKTVEETLETLQNEDL